jgi:hypothetical protein
MITPRFRWPVLLAALLLLCLGCHKSEVQFYRVAKEEAETVEASDPRIHWTVPSGWKTLPPDQMRLGNFVAAGSDGRKVEITVITFPGTAGGELENVNRWRRQISLPPVGADEIKSENTAIGGNAAKVYDLTSAGPATPGGATTRVIAAIALVDGASWFIKMSGDAELVAAQRAAFDQFLKSVSFGAGATPAPAARSAAAEPPAAAPSGEPRAGAPQWQVPADWKPGTASSMRVDSFAFSNGGGAVDISVTKFPGDVGGALANVNRWRGQVGLPAATESQLPGLLTPLDVAGGKAMLVDMTGQSAETGKKTRIIAVSLPQGGSTWFFKMIGDEATVEGQKAAFLKFVQSTKPPNG